MHGMSGTQDARLEAQRTIKRAELTAYLCLPRKAIGPTMVHVGNKRVIDVLCCGEMKCIGSKAHDADLWITVWDKLNDFRAKDTWIKVEHVKARRTEKGKAANVTL